MKRSALIALAAFATALLLAACGGGSSGGSSSTPPKKATAPNAPAGSKVASCQDDDLAAEQLRATAVSCDVARATMTEWENDPVCARGRSSARSSCSIGGLRCQAVKVEGGTAVSCERQGAAVSWLVRSGD